MVCRDTGRTKDGAGIESGESLHPIAKFNCVSATHDTTLVQKKEEVEQLVRRKNELAEEAEDVKQYRGGVEKEEKKLQELEGAEGQAKEELEAGKPVRDVTVEWVAVGRDVCNRVR
jgi:hypothetical protein